MFSLLKSILIWCYLNLIGSFYIVKEQIFDRHKKLPKVLPQKDGKVLVMTGGGRGIGYEALKKLLPLGFHIILGVRRPSQVEEAVKKLCDDLGVDSRKYEVLELDLTSLDSVHSFAEAILAKNIPVHVLINNAGVMFGPKKESKDGFESQFATNYLGHFLLTKLLFPKLKAAGTADESARVVNVSSAAHFAGSWLNFEDLNSNSFYSPEAAYGNSKAAQILFTKYLDKLCKSMENCHVTTIALHPGVVSTDLYVNVNWIRTMTFFMMKTPEQGGDTLVHAAVSPDLEGKGGVYLENSQISRNSSFTDTLGNQVKMWQRSCEILNIDNFFAGAK